MDDPDHTTMRRLVAALFKPRWVAGLEPTIRATARRRLVPLIEERSFDFAADFAALLPCDVMGEIIGIPEPDRDAIRNDNDLLNHCDDGTEQRSAASMAAGLRLAVYYSSLVKERRRQPQDDLVSSLLAARVDGAPLNDEEVVAFLFLMVSVTNESTGRAAHRSGARGHGTRLGIPSCWRNTGPWVHGPALCTETPR